MSDENKGRDGFSLPITGSPVTEPEAPAPDNPRVPQSRGFFITEQGQTRFELSPIRPSPLRLAEHIRLAPWLEPIETTVPFGPVSDRVKLAREIVARTEPRFIEIKAEPRRRATFIEIPFQRGGGRVPFTEAELTAMRGGLTAEEFRWKMIRRWGGADCATLASTQRSKRQVRLSRRPRRGTPSDRHLRPFSD